MTQKKVSFAERLLKIALETRSGYEVMEVNNG